MQRRHMIIPALLIAGSATFAGRGLLTILPLGPDQAASTSAALVQPTSAQDLATREATLTAAEQRLAAIAARRPPALPSIPASTSGASAGTTRVAGSGSGGGSGSATVVATTSRPTAPQQNPAAGGDDRYGEDHDAYENESEAEYEHESEHQEHEGGEHEDD